MSNQYDVIMIGAGPSAIFCAYELKRNKPDMKVLMIEKGRRIEKRACPKRNTKVCVGCKPCSITTGFAGAGAFSDGKLSLSPDVGGNLPEILGYDRTIELLKESDDIYLKFGADEKVYGIDEEEEIASIRKKAIQANLKLIECPIRHLGTEEGYKIYSRLQEHLLNEGVDKICKKVGEESSETIIAAKNDDKDELVGEISDLLFHTFVLMNDRGVKLEDIENKLKERHKVVGNKKEFHTRGEY